ncbi:hypothetical protein ACHAL6_04300 [Proteiniclasticum sp. C24MP]|uniref:hypothetical protein n=1 Tax=Proteiniclasticum sp. C24MP TaxID=3374101 RepID=UPI003754ECA3
MGSRRGGMLYAMMVLVLCSTILVRNYRLFRSHIYIEDGIYSMDVRVNDFLMELEGMESYLNSIYESPDLLMEFLKTGRKIVYKDFTLSYDSSYNRVDVHMISVLDRRINYYRSVLVTEDADQIVLVNKGV